VNYIIQGKKERKEIYIAYSNTGSPKQSWVWFIVNVDVNDLFNVGYITPKAEPSPQFRP
jgi:hypothetical protein